MADLLIDRQSFPSLPSAGQLVIFSDNNIPGICTADSTRYYGQSSNAAVAAQGAGFATDTYLTNSDLIIPTWGIQAKAWWLWQVSASKSGASTAAPIYSVRIGSARTTSDTARLQLTGPLQTAIADIGTLYVLVTARTGGAGTVLQGTAWWAHRGTAANTTTSGTGFANDSTGHVEGTGASFDGSAATVGGGQYIGLSVNGGTSSSWTVTQVIAQGYW